MDVFVEVPRSISIPAVPDGAPVTLELRVIKLSSMYTCSVLKVVVVPFTVRFPVIVKSPAFVCAVAEVSKSPASAGV
jgi:hypothetical protein